MMADAREIQYVVLPDPTDPYLLARIRFPDVFQAISPAQPQWLEDPGLFDLPYDPNSTTVTLEQASAIATEWGARVPSETDDTARPSDRSLIRRMPANWSDLSRAETRAWSLDDLKRSKHKVARQTVAVGETISVSQGSAPDPTVETSEPRRGLRRWGRRKGIESLEPLGPVQLVEDLATAVGTDETTSTVVAGEEPEQALEGAMRMILQADGSAIDLADEHEHAVIDLTEPDVDLDLTDTREDALATAEDA
ncbi:MAG: hypothetical protein JWL73_3409 [Actinomycetia bacterium]|nr:hypothetical protein [Actinomycetes bacterium]